MTASNQFPVSCPKCGASMDGGPIPGDISATRTQPDCTDWTSLLERACRLARSDRAPFRWCRAIIVNVIDGKERWQCPDCHHEWR